MMEERELASQATRHLSENNISDALRCLQQLLDLDCDDEFTREHLIVYVGKGIQEAVAKECMAMLLMRWEYVLALLLLGYLFARSMISASFRSDRSKIIIDMIGRRPWSPILGSAYCALAPTADQGAMDEAARLWSNHILTFSEDVRVLRNATDFFTIHDRSIAEQICIRLLDVDPHNGEWSLNVAELYYLKATEKPDVMHELDKAIAILRKAADKSPNPVQKTQLLITLGKIALYANEPIIAMRAAREVELIQSSIRNDVGFTNKHKFDSYLIMGSVELGNKNINEAVGWMRRSIDIMDHNCISPFGPNMVLALGLLRAGLNKPVVDFIEAASMYWGQTDHKPELWLHEIREGRIPDFGANLYY